MKASGFFDYVFSSEMNFSDLPVKNISELIFKKLEHRDENAEIILSHNENILITISLKRLRFIVSELYSIFKAKKINRGDTVLLASISGNNELFTSLLFIALSSYGVKVLLPMYLETNSLVEWLEEAECNSIVIPEKEIFSLSHHEKEKSIIQDLINIAIRNELPCHDIFRDFNFPKLLYEDLPSINFLNEPMVIEAIGKTQSETEAMLITTSGSAGKSKIVVYNQGSFIKSCLSWQKAGFYDKDKIGGRGFTPLFTHTMGVRAFFNAVWTGVPVCLIKTEWFKEKPETVRYFLMEMKPEHITGGPAVYNMLLEIIRNFPELKSVLKNSLKTLISSGAPLDVDTVIALESSFDLTLHNAFGTTETQQVLNTLLYKQPTESELGSLGNPLPGVKIGLKKVIENDGLYRMFVNSEFGMKRNLVKAETAKEIPEDFFDTGDIVELTGKKIISYIGRENRDFFKDGFGVKIPLKSVKQHYKKLDKISQHIEYFPLKCTPGIAALLFIKNEGIQKGIVSDGRIVGDYLNLIESINTELNIILEPFEYRHRLIKRFALVNDEVPVTVKGNPSQFQIKFLYNNLIAKLIDTLTNDAAVNDLKQPTEIDNPFSKYHNPHIGQLLSALCLDKAYHKAKKDSLFTYRNGTEVEILDITGGYGSNLLGHNNIEIKDTVSTFLQADGVAISDQGSMQKNVGMLAEKLNLIVGKKTSCSYTVLFGSTGSEAVEIALHHSLFEWRKKIELLEQSQYQRYGAEAANLLKSVWESNKAILSKTRVHVIALKNAFHGSTSGPRSILGNDKKRNSFQNILSILPVFIDDLSPEWFEHLSNEVENKTIKLNEVVYHDEKYSSREFSLSTIVAAFAEPIIGEGGIRFANHNVLKELSRFDFPLIMDEIQCGLGRSGSIPTLLNIKADYYLFGKSLGGNIEKISAVLIDNNNYKAEFGEYFTSTFANGGLAARVALKTLTIINDQKIPEKAKLLGEKIKSKLLLIKEKYPKVIAEISGAGLMLGIRFSDRSNDRSAFLRNLYIHDYCGMLYSSYLLNKHDVRIFPTLSAPNILRVEPSAFITDTEITKLTNSIEDLAEKIDRRKFYDLFVPLMDGDPFLDNKGRIPDDGFMETVLEKPHGDSIQVAMIAHFAYPTEELRILEKDFCKASDTGLRILFNRLQVLLQMKPIALLRKNLYGGKINFTFITIPVDSAELERLNKQNKRKKIITKIQEAVDLAAKMGIQIVSLGAYTSILSNNGLALAEPTKTKIVTGNTLTAASGIYRLIEQIKSENRFNENNTLGVIGASGNIGSIIAEGLLESDLHFEKVYLIGRNKNKLSKTLNEIYHNHDQENIPEIEIVTNLSQLKNCNIIIVASNSNAPFVHKHHLSKDRPVILSDLSMPAAISKDVTLMSNIINIPFASYIHLPDDPDFKISSHTPRGAVFCCAAEAILIGLERVDKTLKGKITKDGIRVVTDLANKYGFFDKLGEVKTYKSDI